MPYNVYDQNGPRTKDGGRPKVATLASREEAIDYIKRVNPGKEVDYQLAPYGAAILVFVDKDYSYCVTTWNPGDPDE